MTHLIPPSIPRSERMKAFVAWTKAHPASWNLAGWWEDGKFQRFSDPDTDNAWLGFCAGWEAGRKSSEAPLNPERA